MNPLSAAYAAVAAARRRSYERHPERRFRLKRPVISVGNISVGGSGKTPAVAHIARLLLEAGERPAVLSRGYRRRQPTEGVLIVSDGVRLCADVERAGDEPMMLARALPGVAVFVGADRFRSGLVAETAFGCTVHILDDGFQHVRLARDADIVLVRPEDLHDRVLPVGRLRESVEALSRAHAIVLHEAASAEEHRHIPDGVTDNRFSARASIRMPGARALDRGLPASADSRLSTTPTSDCGLRTADFVFAVAGIARPRRFFDALASSGLRVAGEMTFRDHQWFTPSHLAQMISAARRSGATRIVTTEKDYVRLLPLRPFAMPIASVPLEFAIEPAAEFRAWLLGCVAGAKEILSVQTGQAAAIAGGSGAAGARTPGPPGTRTSGLIDSQRRA